MCKMNCLNENCLDGSNLIPMIWLTVWISVPKNEIDIQTVQFPISRENWIEPTKYTFFFLLLFLQKISKM